MIEPFTVRDVIRRFSSLTPSRAWNAGKVLGSYLLSRITGKAWIAGLPVSASIEPTTSCNLRCPECPSGRRSFTRDTGMLDEAFFREMIDGMRSHLISLNLYFQGEPYLHPKFLDMAKYASSKRIRVVSSTNGHLLTEDAARRTVESGLNSLIISVDGTTQETYARYRVGGSLSEVLDGARRIVEWKKRLKSATPRLIFQFLVLKSNEHQIEDVKRLARECGVDRIRLKTAQFYEFENGHELIPTRGKFTRYERNPSGKWNIKSGLPNHCWRMWHACVITWDGWVVPCCFDKDAGHRFGNMKDRPLREIWRGGSYRAFRSSLLKARHKIDICGNCTEGIKSRT